MRTNTYKLANVARPGQYVSLANGNIVGHSDQPGVMIEVQSILLTNSYGFPRLSLNAFLQWFAMFHEGGLATFQAVRKGEVCDEYIYFDPNTLSLTCSNNP